MRETVVAVFDFDGTITRKDTFNAFLAEWFGWSRFAAALLSRATLLARYALDQASNHEVKESLFGHFLTGCEQSIFDGRCREFSEKAIPRLVRPGALRRIADHLSNGDRVVVVSASIEDWVVPWCRAQGISAVAATGVEIAGGRLTGRFSTPSCYGPEKVHRLRQLVPERSRIIAYGDSRGDRELLAYAHEGHYRAFH